MIKIVTPMKPIITRWTLIACIFFFVGCSDDNDFPGSGSTSSQGGSNSNSGDWLIPVNQVLPGGPGKDGIPSIDQPNFIPVDQVDFMEPTDLIIGFKSGNVVKGYPHLILDWHEIVNDDVNGVKLSVVYCPLTGTATGWDRIVNGTETTFGVSGLLFQSNIIPYDRATDSNWSQMELQCVNGALIGARPELHMLVETSWENWREMYPNSEILSTNTGTSRPYGVYPYGDYRTNSALLEFFTADVDERLHPKERALGVITDNAVKGYSINAFGTEVSMIEDSVGGEEVIIIGSRIRNFMVAFSPRIKGTLLSFETAQNEGEVILRSDDGTAWNIFGEAVSGPREGERLSNMNSYIGYWFAWGAFENGLQLYTN